MRWEWEWERGWGGGVGVESAASLTNGGPWPELVRPTHCWNQEQQQARSSHNIAPDHGAGEHGDGKGPRVV
jgi:hypothetical protein